MKIFSFLIITYIFSVCLNEVVVLEMRFQEQTLVDSSFLLLSYTYHETVHAFQAIINAYFLDELVE